MSENQRQSKDTDSDDVRSDSMGNKSIFSSAKEILNNYWFWLCGALALASFVLGFVGFVYGFPSDSNMDILDCLYYALQLFTFESLPEGLIENLYIKFAKLCAPISIALFSFKAFYMLLSEHLMMLKLRRYKGHVVICGLGTKGMIILNKKLKDGKKVVVIEKSYENVDIPTCKALKVPVIIGDATEDAILKKSIYKYAIEIYILTSNDMSNITIAQKIKDETLCPIKRNESQQQDKNRNNPKKTCFFHIHNHELKLSVDKEDWIITKSDCLDIKVFNIYELVARHIVKDIALEPLGQNHIPHNQEAPQSVKDIVLEPLGQNVVTVENPWVIVIGFGAIGSAIVRQLIRMKVYPDEKRLCITIIDKDAKQHEEIFHSIYYDPVDKERIIFKNVDIAFVEKDIRKVHDLNGIIGDSNGMLPHNIYICTGDDITTSILTHKLKADIPQDTKHKIKIIACFVNSAVKTENIIEKNVLIHNINIKEEGCNSLMDLDKKDILAKLIHSDFFNKTFPDYLKKQNIDILEALNKILNDSSLSIFEKEEKIRDEEEFKGYVKKWIEEKPSRKRWYELAEEFKNSNRLQADHMLDKLKVLNPDFNLSTPPDNIAKEIKKNSNLDLLAELEYKRYWAEKFVLRQKDYIEEYVKNRKFKEFSELGEEEKDWNRGIINLMPNLIKEHQEIEKKSKKKEGRK